MQRFVESVGRTQPLKHTVVREEAYRVSHESVGHKMLNFTLTWT